MDISHRVKILQNETVWANAAKMPPEAWHAWCPQLGWQAWCPQLGWSKLPSAGWLSEYTWFDATEDGLRHSRLACSLKGPIRPRRRALQSA